MARIAPRIGAIKLQSSCAHERFNRLHAEQLLYLPGVRQIRSFMVLKEVLSTTQLNV